MYKDDYTLEDWIADECSDQIKNKLQKRYDELEEQRDAINDRYPFDDLYLQWAKVDCEKNIILSLLEHLADCTKNIKNDIMM